MQLIIASPAKIILHLNCVTNTDLTEDLWMTLNEEHYATAKRMISASSTKTFDKPRSTQITKFTKLTSSRRKNCRRQEDFTCLARARIN